MRRYPHLIGRLRDAGWPTEVMILECDAQESPLRDSGGPIVRRHWYSSVAMCRSRQGVLTLDYADDFNDLESTWRHIESWASMHGTRWIFSTQCQTVWAVLGLWDRLESGFIRIVDYDYVGVTAEAQAERQVRRAQRNPLTNPPQRAIDDMIGAAHGYIVLEDPPNIIKCRIGTLPGKIVWVDTRNYGVECDTAPDDCVQRALWVAQWLCDYRAAAKTYRLGGLCSTAGSQSMTAFRSGYWSAGIYCHSHEPILQLESEAYYGGRTECYRVGSSDQELYVLDVRSMYPAICRDCDLPVTPDEYCEVRAGQPPKTLLRDGTVAARVAIDTPEAAYPLRRWHSSRAGNYGYGASPYRLQCRGVSEVIYPVGRFITTLGGPELQDALERGRVKKVLAWCSYKMGRPLAEYATGLYDMRCYADALPNSGLKQMAKSLLVTLPGKFGQRSREWILDPCAYPHEMWGEWSELDEVGNNCRVRAIGGVVFRERIGGFSADAVPSLAGWITSFGRLRLLEALRCAGWDNLWYADTDCVVVNAEGHDRLGEHGLIAERALGKFELRARSSNVTIWGPKMYAIDGNLTCAGVPKGAALDGDGGFSYEKEASAKEHIRQGKLPESVATRIGFRRDCPYTHRVVGGSGTTEPIVLDQW